MREYVDILLEIPVRIVLALVEELTRLQTGKVKRSIEEGADARAFLGVRELTDHGGSGDYCEGNTEAEKEACNNEHRNCDETRSTVEQARSKIVRTILRCSLQSRANNHDHTPEEDGPSASHFVGDKWYEGKRTY